MTPNLLSLINSFGVFVASLAGVFIFVITIFAHQEFDNNILNMMLRATIIFSCGMVMALLK
jgi:hypothetical protein